MVQAAFGPPTNYFYGLASMSFSFSFSFFLYTNFVCLVAPYFDLGDQRGNDDLTEDQVYTLMESSYQNVIDQDIGPNMQIANQYNIGIIFLPLIYSLFLFLFTIL